MLSMVLIRAQKFDIVLHIVSTWTKSLANIFEPTATSLDMASHIVLDSTIISVTKPAIVEERLKDKLHMIPSWT